MEATFWHQKWKNNEIGFHNSVVNPLLVKHLDALSLKPGSRLFIPLCGKTLDIAWLLSQGYCVAGAELSPIAVDQLFKELGVEPKIQEMNQILYYSAKNIDLFVGDLFNLSKEMLPPIDAIYDRAALVALPEEMRIQYTKHLIEITNTAPQLLITFEYEQHLMEGPPFSISDKALNLYYKNSYGLNLIANNNVSGGLKGRCPAKEKVWLLKNKE